MREKGRGVMRKKRHMYVMFLMSLLVSFCSQGEELRKDEKAYVIIIIDDFGNNLAGTEELLKLSIPWTGAVIPGMPFDKEDAEKLYAAGKEVIYHVPLEPLQGKKEWLGPKGIFAGMGEEKIKTILDEAALEISYAKGMNNHMGSKAMKSEATVRGLMAYAKAHDLYFVDSKTTDTALSSRLSQEYGVPFLERNVFLDNTPDTGAVKERLRDTMKIAKAKGMAIAIGHVGPQKGPHTARGLKEMIPIMEDAGIEFITVSEYLKLIK